MTDRPARPYWNPYLAGFVLGLVLLAAFVIMGRGLGVSGAVTSVVVTGTNAVASGHLADNPYAQAYLGDGTTSPLKDWLVIEVVGVILGGLVSGVLAGRFRWSVEKGPRISTGGRLLYAFGGGAIMGFATRVARGCTSGQALTGGALLATGSWIFIVACFATGYALSPLARRFWR